MSTPSSPRRSTAAPATPTGRAASWGLAVASLVLFVALAAWLVPWSWVPGGRPVAVRPDEVLTASQISRAETYAALQRHLGWASLATSTVVSLVLGLTPLGARVVARIPGRWWVRALLATFLVLLVGRLATLPFALLSRRHALAYGLTDQALAGWLRDRAVQLGVSWVYAALVVLLVVGAARRAPRQWPVVVGTVAATLVVLGSWLYPLAVEPLFNRFVPLPDGQLRSRILELAREEGVPVSDVLVADASRRTTTLNAYVSGLGSTRRVVLYDNLVEGVPQRETLVIVAHELGHARAHDVAIGTGLGAVGVLFGGGLLGVVLRRRLLGRAGATSVGQPEVVPLVLALVAVGTLLASPVQNTVSRAIEARADRASLAATGDERGFEEVQVQLAVRALADPAPPAWSQFWFGSHPTLVQRIGIARALDDGRR
ncbi:STE24 endopeptidase [Nocardioides scoriae]|uniref:STE24 endopeptidase n=1 Tax=Nocardioides scoriae TaxID=642780 RepID=A0A1H1MK68_9ACTN|nr:M48 family metallopeptidase [Nocardioides scoriae]SDR87012.1 STE24 endopeptidase [Nocardioides scoriae]